MNQEESEMDRALREQTTRLDIYEAQEWHAKEEKRGDTRLGSSLARDNMQSLREGLVVYDIGWAVRELRLGQQVRRAGWNGKGMYVAYQPGYPHGIPINANTARATGQPEGTVCIFLPYVMMRTADGSFVPWLCSQTDLLALDWEYAR